MLKKINHTLIMIGAIITAMFVFTYSYFRYCFMEDISLFWIKNRVAICEGALAALFIGLLTLMIPLYEPLYVLGATITICALSYNVDFVKKHNEKIFLISYIITSIASGLYLYLFNFANLYFILIYIIAFFPFYYLFKKAYAYA